MSNALKTFAAIALIAAAAPSTAAPVVKIGQPAPEATLTMLNGDPLKLSSLRGQVVVLNYWATWCVPCRTELPLLDRYYRIQAKNGLRVFAVTTEDSLPAKVLKP